MVDMNVIRDAVLKDTDAELANYLFIVFDILLFTVPSVAYWVWIRDIVADWGDDFNTWYANVWKWGTWGSIALYGFTFFFNMVALSGDWTDDIQKQFAEYSTVTVTIFGTFAQLVLFIFNLLATIWYEEDGEGFWLSTGGAWTQFGIWTLLNLSAYLVFWLFDTEHRMWYGSSLALPWDDEDEASDIATAVAAAIAAFTP